MALDDFYTYLLLYTEQYYEKYLTNITGIGDLFYDMRGGTNALNKWILSRGDFYVYNKVNAPSPGIYIHNNVQNTNNLPAYAIALQELFYEEFDYYSEENKPIRKKIAEILQSQVASSCKVARNTVSSWKTGVRIPNKYNWWALAITFLDLSYQMLPPFLDMIGCTVDLTCLDDVILYYSLCSEKSGQETFALLKKYSCNHTAEIFAPNIE